MTEAAEGTHDALAAAAAPAVADGGERGDGSVGESRSSKRAFSVLALLALTTVDTYEWSTSMVMGGLTVVAPTCCSLLSVPSGPASLLFPRPS